MTTSGDKPGAATVCVYDFTSRSQVHSLAKAAWLKGAATPPALFLKLSNIAMCSHDDLWEEDGEGVERPIPLNRLSQRAKDAIRSRKFKDRVIAGDGGEGTLMSREVEIAVHDPQKAAQMIISIWGEEALAFARIDGEADGSTGPTKARGLHIAMASKDRTFTLTDREVDFAVKSEAEYIKELIDG